MGMDVVGVSPVSQVGEYFRANIWYWRPMWLYIEKSFPDLAAKVESPYTNEGYGLDVCNSVLLGQKINSHVDGGLARRHEEIFNSAIADLPLTNCQLCYGTGERVWPAHITQDWILHHNGCNGCLGTGLQRDCLSSYTFSAELLEKFSHFLIDCGGFEIW